MIQLKSRFHPRIALFVSIAMTVLILSFLWFIGVLTDNFRVVTPGKFYRAGQMTEENLRQVVSMYQIHTIVNLRGSHKRDWYIEEKKVAKELNIHHVDICLDYNRLPPPQALTDLLHVLQTSPYPILIHCKAGADRSGLASVIYRVVVEKLSLCSALNEQLTWRYGHFPIGEVRAMDDFFDLYLKKGDGKNFERWIVEDYPSFYKQWRTSRVNTSF
jgi:undecaprenyl-diphosphatase